MNKPEARGDGVRASAWDKLELLEDRAELCSEWLSLTASMMKGVRRGVVILRGERGGELSPHAVWPEDGGVPELLVGAALVALKTGECITPGEGADASDRIVQPLTTDGELWGVIALEVDPRSIERLHGLQRGLQASSGWLMRLGRAREERSKATVTGALGEHATATLGAADRIRQPRAVGRVADHRRSRAVERVGSAPGSRNSPQSLQSHAEGPREAAAAPGSSR